MRIAVASGKGGTGKTTIAVSLALSLANEGSTLPPIFIDCDVEAPNAHLFLKPRLESSRPVGIMIPVVDEARCTSCGKCAEVCAYHAIAVLGRKTLVFPQLCHGCGSCDIQCPEHAISEKLYPIGVIESGSARAGIDFRHGILEIGQPMAVPIIRALQRELKPHSGQVVVLDSPPGSSCPVVATMRGADYLLLVTESTPFGLHDLQLAVQVAQELKLPTGVILNRDNGVYPELEKFCRSAGLPILLRIPFDRAIATGTAQGKSLIEIRPEYLEQFRLVAAGMAKVCGKPLPTVRSDRIPVRSG
jgi:MinD superfamily P-loop ATPase